MQCERTGCTEEVKKPFYVNHRVYCSTQCYVANNHAFFDPTKLLKGEGYVANLGICVGGHGDRIPRR